MIDSGKLDKRIAIQQSTATQDSAGQPVLSWALLATVWAEFVQRRAGERIAADQILGTETIILRLRYRDDVTDKMRFSYGGRYYDIRSVVELGHREGLELTATASTS